MEQLFIYTLNVYPNKKINGRTFKLFAATKYVTVIRPDLDFSSNVNSDFDTSTGIISTLLTCEKVLSEQLSILPLEVYVSSKDKGKVKDKEHALYRLLHSPKRYIKNVALFLCLISSRPIIYSLSNLVALSIVSL